MKFILRFASNKTTFREVSNLFNISVSTMQAVVGKIVNFIVETVAKERIVFPNDEEKPAVAREFEKVSMFLMFLVVCVFQWGLFISDIWISECFGLH